MLSDRRILIVAVLVILLLLFLCARSASAQDSEERKLDKWWREYQQAPVESEQRVKLLAQLDSLKVDFDVWLEKYDDPVIGSELRAKLLKILSKEAKIYPRQKALWQRIPADKDLMKKLLNEMLESASNSGEVLDLCLRVTPGTGFERKAARKLERFYIALDELVAVYLNSPNSFYILKEALLKNIAEETSAEFEEWERVNAKCSEDDPLWEISFEKMQKTAKVHKHWLTVLRKVEEKDRKLWEKTFKKCLETATCFKEYLANGDETETGSKEWRQSMENALKSAKNYREVREVLKRVQPGSDLETRAKEKLKKIEKDLEEKQQDPPPAEKVGDFIEVKLQ